MDGRVPTIRAACIRINLTGTLARDPRYQQDYRLLWDNQLHPTWMAMSCWQR